MTRKFPMITAHTGCMGKPDNTLASAEMGLTHGADIVEDDIRVTLDGFPVLAHDDSLLLSNGVERHISKMTYTDLCELEIQARHGVEGESIRITALESLLLLIKTTDKLVNLDLKTDECIKPVVDMVLKYDMLDQVILSGCETERALKVEQINPRLRKLLNADSNLFLKLGFKEAIELTCKDAITAGCFGINIYYRFMSNELIEAANARNLPICVWTVNDETQMKIMIEMGAYSITTRNVLALAALK
jgi:glycerophosphoryl diester phosphodiesterase